MVTSHFGGKRGGEEKQEGYGGRGGRRQRLARRKKEREKGKENDIVLMSGHLTSSFLPSFFGLLPGWRAREEEVLLPRVPRGDLS